MFRGLSENVFKSKVAKRIFGLFILAAFIPVILISLISFNYISTQLDQESRRQLYRESRSLGLVIFDRLTSLDINIKIIVSGLQRGVSPEFFEKDEWLRTIFKALFIIDEKGNWERIFGYSDFYNELTDRQIGYLKKGDTILYIPHKGGESSNIYLIRTVGKGDNNLRYLVAEINDEFLWNLGIYNPDVFCILTQAGRKFYCSNSYKGDFSGLDLAAASKLTGGKSNHTWVFNGETYAIHAWNLFLDAGFHAENLYVLFGAPQRTAFSFFSGYKSVFPQAILFTVLIAILLSISQIRKYLVPLEKLKDGTVRIAQGVFNKPVSIKSGDEFEDLSHSFNNMGEKIHDQIKTITLFAEIDRLILSSLDTGFIIETLIEHLRSIIDADHIGIIAIEDLDTGSAVLNINTTLENIEKIEIQLNRDEIKEINLCDIYLRLNDKKERSYLNKARDLGDASFLLFPVHIKGELSGIILLGSSTELELDEDKVSKITELTHRVAVAFSNAAWEEKLYYQAHYDGLTDLPNRFLFRDRVKQALEYANRSNSLLAIMFIDLDDFKGINDSLGHIFGDEVLKYVGGILTGCVRSYDTIARFGGDEFVVLITEAETPFKIISEATEMSNRILEHIARPFTLNDREIYITPSIGIAVYPRDGRNYDDLLKNADSAMYRAKEKGRGNFEFYQAVYNADALERFELRNELRNALERNEFRLNYQPRINCRTGMPIGAEVLLRWDHPRLGMISPTRFIPIAEETGLIEPIGYWVLETACKQNRAWLDSGHDIDISVNLSPVQLKQPDLLWKIKDIIEKSGMPSRRLEVEITENVTVKDYDNTIKFLNEARELDISISIDDFGTGYSSMAYLQKFSIDRLKIDQSFIRNIPEDTDSVLIVKAIIAMAHSLDISVVGEGVRTQAQYDFLRDLDCDEIQGYICSQPLTVEEFNAYLQKRGEKTGT